MFKRNALRWNLCVSTSIKGVLFGTMLVVQSASIPVNGATLSPLSATGFDQDFIWALSEASPAVGTGTTISHNNFVYYETGAVHNSGAGGLPSTSFVSNFNANTTFQLQPFADANNSLDLENHVAKTLTLTSPGSFAAIAFLGAAGNDTPILTYTLNFLGGTTTTANFTFNDWTAPNAITSLLVTTGGSYLNSPAVGLSETDITLSPADQAKTLLSITFQQPVGQGGFSWVTAVSAAAVPEPASGVLFGLGAIVLLAARRRRRAHRNTLG